MLPIVLWRWVAGAALCDQQPGGTMDALWQRIVALLVLVSLLATVSASDPEGDSAIAGGIGPLTTTLAYPAPPLLATAAAVMDVDSGAWLRLDNADTPLPMASTTKIMTAVLAIEHGHLQDRVRVSKAAASVGQSTMGLVEGEQVTMTDLLYGLLIPSGNDAAIAIAERVSGSVPRFVALMNERAQQLGLTHTHYTNPYGFSNTSDGDDPDHYTSARDLVLLARFAMRYPLFRTIVSTKHYIVPQTKHNKKHDLQTVNYFVNWYPGADGVKPGWTSGAGICQVIDVKRDGRHILAAILHTPNLYTDSRDLMNYALNDFTWVPSGYGGDTPDQVVVGGTKSDPEWYFPYTGHSVSGQFLTYFRKHGGYAALGAPETEAVDVDGTQTQFFSAQQLVYDQFQHTVVPLQLGFAAIPGQDWLSRVAKVKDTPSTQYYPQTGHTVTNRFLRYYLVHGGPATFGYPITEKRVQGGKLVQYFEDAELVWSAKPDALDGYVYVGSLGIRSLVTEGLIEGDHLPPALHIPMTLPAPTPNAGIGNHLNGKVATLVQPAGKRGAATPARRIQAIAATPAPGTGSPPSTTPSPTATGQPSATATPSRPPASATETSTASPTVAPPAATAAPPLATAAATQSLTPASTAAAETAAAAVTGTPSS